MTIYSRVIKQIEENKRIKDEGGFNAIPWLSLPKFSSVIPGVMQKTYYLLTANSKVGKSQLGDFLFILEPYNFTKQFPDSGISIDIEYFLLEMSKEEKITAFISHFLFVDRGIRISPKKLLSMYKEKTLSDEVFNITKSTSYADKFEDFEDKVHIHDTIGNPWGIYKHVYEYARNNGFYIAKNGEKIDWDDLKPESKSDAYKYISHYKPNKAREYKIILVDHTSLLSTEKKYPTLHSTMDNWSSERALDLKKKFGYTIVDIQQQSAE